MRHVCTDHSLIPEAAACCVLPSISFCLIKTTRQWVINLTPPGGRQSFIPTGKFYCRDRQKSLSRITGSIEHPQSRVQRRIPCPERYSVARSKHLLPPEATLCVWSLLLFSPSVVIGLGRVDIQVFRPGKSHFGRQIPQIGAKSPILHKLSQMWLSVPLRNESGQFT